MVKASEPVLETFLNTFRPFPKGVLPRTLAERTGLSVEELGPIRERLVADGFRFEDDDDGRWILAGKPDALLPYWVRAGLRCDRLAQQIYYRKEVESTQDVAFELVAEGRPHGTLVLTEHQTAGRGRGNAVWHSSPKCSLLFSLILDLEPPETFASVLIVATATAVARAIQEIADLPPRTKFPNDILVRGKKVAGILLEVKNLGGPLRRAVAGVGLNVNQLEEDFPEDLRESATSLRIERRDKAPLRRARLLRRILWDLERWLDQISHDRYEELDEAWNRYSGMVGRDAEFVAGGEPNSGRILDATLRKGLLIRLTDGQERLFRLEHLSSLTLR